MHAFDLPKQDILTTDLLIGTDGEKMSKSKPNCILIDDTPFDMYQKLINVRDDLIIHYFELATDMTLEEVEVIKKRLESGEHPNILKKELADRVVTMYHGKPYNPDDIENIEGYSLKSITDITTNIKIQSLLVHM
jgi:tyrosyl-tRNA synthetase